MASLAEVITVSVTEDGSGVIPDNPNVVAIFTQSQGGPLDTANRYAVYTNLQDVITDWGASSNEASYAAVFFAQSPNPVAAGGRLIIGYHRGATESVAATAGTLESAALTVSELVASLQAISDGTFDITIDGTEINATALDFRTCTTLAEVAAVIDTAVASKASCVATDDNTLLITSDTTGATSTMTYMSDPGSGTYVGALLTMETGTGATLTQGAASDSLSAETKVAALTAVYALVRFKGAMFITASAAGASLPEHEAYLMGVWGTANRVLIYDVFTGATAYAVSATNIVWYCKLASLQYLRMIYSSVGNRKFAAAYMSRMHTVNFAAENTAITMQLKSLAGVAAEDLSSSVIAACKTVGLDVYVPMKGSTGPAKLLTSGANGYTDSLYNKAAYVEALETDLFNVLATTGTKIAQTTAGMNALVDQAEKTTQRFVRAGYFAPGTWTSTTRFGNVAQFDRAIEQQGFFALAGLIADQSTADRAARKSTPIQIACKEAGAIHSAELIVYINA